MIKEIYIDNFKSLSNFKIQPADVQLWLGDNGSGKTAVLDALRMIQQILNGGHVEDVFKGQSLTRWDQRLDQTVSVQLEIKGESYEYELIVEYTERRDTCRIKKETLKWCKNIFFEFDGRDAHLYRINNISNKPEEGTCFPADWRRSLISSIAERDDNYPLIRFRREVECWLIVQSVPPMIKKEAEEEAEYISRYAENFAKWYRYVLQENTDVTYRARKLLEDVLPGFEGLSLKRSGESRILTATFRVKGRDCSFEFGNLSDGQRQLIILYTILESFRHGDHSVLFVDEPDNFVSLREVQPWLNELVDMCESKSKQAIVISHHPEIVNQMAHGKEAWFSRPQGAHTVIKPYPTTDGLTPAETMARGWDDE